MTETDYIDKEKNIFVDTAQTCNLLCKIIVDYIPNKYCNILDVKNTQDGTGQETQLGTPENEIKTIKYEIFFSSLQVGTL